MPIKHIKRPELFQGANHKENYFEGWYFRHVTADGAHTIAFIPGISISGADSHSFVQVIISPEIKTYYFRYPLEAFVPADEPFSVTVGESVFSLTGCHIALHDPAEGISITGDMHYSGITPIKTSPMMPGIMGFFAYFPGMECNHGVLSMTHHVNGHVGFGLNHLIDFTGGRGYIEKDWGTSFPSEYIWIQANHFAGEQDSFMCSIAKVPFAGLTFRGLIANLHFAGKEYRFATYNLARIKHYVIEENRVAFDLVKGDVSLSCEAIMSESGALKAPERGEMRRTIKEGLGGEVKLVLKRKGKSPVTLTSRYAGIEIVK